MTILGIETSCDETAVSVLDVNGPEDIKIRSNIVSSQIKLHAEFGGVVPNLAAREHVKNISHVFETALAKAGIKDFEKEIDLISVTRGPGLGPALLVGVTFAKTIAMIHNKPLVGASHLEGHIFSNWLNQDFKEPSFPILNLIVSGGHTELISMKDHHTFELIGETVDDAVGEAFDKVARLLGLGYPGGPEIYKISQTGSSARFPLPRPMLHSGNFNFSFSGLKTAVLYLVRDLKEKGLEIDQQIKANIAAAFQEAAIEVLTKKTLQAAQENGVSAIMLSGGVSANLALREKLKEICAENNILFYCPPLEFTGDNATMIALAGYFSYQKNKTTDWTKVEMQPNLGF